MACNHTHTHRNDFDRLAQKSKRQTLVPLPGRVNFNDNDPKQFWRRIGKVGKGNERQMSIPIEVTLDDRIFQGFNMSQSDCQSRTSPERLGSAASSLGIVPFGFHSKTQYDANETLIQIRSENYEPKEPIKDNNIWKRPPPDFRPQIFAPKPPKRNSRESMQPWNYGTIPGQREIIKRERQKVIPHILLPLKEDRTRFVTTGRIMRPFTAKKKFVTEGMYNPGPFADIREHDFRGRFRLRHRPAKSAFMERVSNTLESRWAKEKMEETLATVSS
ncbi:unnamed protein product [Mytilus coruscus]|uniref:Uncharacterized protein n=1 Tax=Mytilus coruscus TaxID=42192 RepID=A0A6J8DIF6_MYTCO|nr:unnamed protein product [Mytilus coruscus]